MSVRIRMHCYQKSPTDANSRLFTSAQKPRTWWNQTGWVQASKTARPIEASEALEHAALVFYPFSMH